MKRYTHNPLKYYKLDPSVKVPIFATEGSACFDIHAHIPHGTKIKIYDEFGNLQITIDIKTFMIFCFFIDIS